MEAEEETFVVGLSLHLLPFYFTSVLNRVQWRLSVMSGDQDRKGLLFTAEEINTTTNAPHAHTVGRASAPGSLPKAALAAVGQAGCCRVKERDTCSGRPGGAREFLLVPVTHRSGSQPPGCQGQLPRSCLWPV